MPDYLDPSRYLDPANVLNPFMLWADMGLRALDLTVASSQNLSEGVDRFTRASASTGGTEAALSFAAPVREPGSRSTMLLGSQVQRSMLDLMTQGWLQWMAALGSFVSLAAGRTLSNETRRNLPADLTSGELTSGRAATAHTRAQSETPSDQQHGRRAEAHAPREPMEHAVAASDSRRRRTGGTRAGTTRAGTTRSRAKPRTRRA